MIEINLLPDEMKKKASIFSKLDLSSFSIKNIPILPAAAGVAGILIMVQVVVFAMSLYAQLSLVSLQKRFDAIVPSKKEADALKAKSQNIAKRVNAIDELMGKRFSWARKLNALSDSITPGIWLSLLEHDERPTTSASGSRPKGAGMPGALILNGYAAGAGEQAALVGRFIKSLKDNESFYSDFSEINLVATKADKVENQEAMNFKISCVFK